jgi:hypothetical protein
MAITRIVRMTTGCGITVPSAPDFNPIIASLKVPGEEEGPLGALSNGGRFSVDYRDSEYSSPETTNPRDSVIWDSPRTPGNSAARWTGSPSTRSSIDTSRTTVWAGAMPAFGPPITEGCK